MSSFFNPVQKNDKPNRKRDFVPKCDRHIMQFIKTLTDKHAKKLPLKYQQNRKQNNPLLCNAHT